MLFFLSLSPPIHSHSLTTSRRGRSTLHNGASREHHSDDVAHYDVDGDGDDNGDSTRDEERIPVPRALTESTHARVWTTSRRPPDHSNTQHVCVRCVRIVAVPCSVCRALCAVLCVLCRC